MSRTSAAEPAPADLSDVRAGDCSFRWWVRSRTNPRKEYLVDVSSYGGHGKCTCPDFETRFEKFLARGVTPQEVWDDRWLWEEGEERALRPYQIGVDDVLRCWHLCRARSKVATAFIAAASAAVDAQRSR